MCLLPRRHFFAAPEKMRLSAIDWAGLSQSIPYSLALFLTRNKRVDVLRGNSIVSRRALEQRAGASRAARHTDQLAAYLLGEIRVIHHAVRKRTQRVGLF